MAQADHCEYLAPGISWGKSSSCHFSVWVPAAAEISAQFALARERTFPRLAQPWFTRRPAALKLNLSPNLCIQLSLMTPTKWLKSFRRSFRSLKTELQMNVSFGRWLQTRLALRSTAIAPEAVSSGKNRALAIYNNFLIFLEFHFHYR